MPRYLFDFVCSDGHTTEALVNSDDHTAACTVCDKPAQRQVCAPRAKLDGTSGHFPSAADAWVKRRERHIKHENKVAANHGSDALWD